MATTYIETSALVKRYVAEVGSAWVRRMVARPVQHVIYTAALTEVEVRSALQRLVCLIFLYSARSIAHWGSEREKTQPLEQFSVAY